MANTNIPRGPGSSSPDFTPPSVNVATPGLQTPEQPTEFERLRDTLAAIGGGLATGLQRQAAVRQSINSLKERAVNTYERDKERGAAALQAKRLSSQKREMVRLQIEGEEKGPLWIAQQARARMNNAASAEEETMWGQFYLSASDAAKREMAEAERDTELRIQQDYNRAGRTASNIVTQLKSQLAQDDDLRRELMGDGKNISANVQDWLLAEVTAASPRAFLIGQGDPMSDMKKEQREMLTARLMEQSMSIADSLTKAHLKEQEQGSFLHGIEQIDSDLMDFVRRGDAPRPSGTIGGQEVEATDPDMTYMSRSMEAVFDEWFAHMPPAEKVGAMKSRVVDILASAASGQLGDNVGEMMGRGEQLLNMKVDGKPLFSELERAQLSAQLMQTARSTAEGIFDGEVGRAIQGQTQVVMNGLGESKHVPHPNALGVMSTPGSDGLTTMDHIANETLMQMGLIDLDEDELTTGQALIVNAVRTRAGQMQSQGRAAASARTTAVQNRNMVVQGIPGADADDAYNYTPSTRVLRGGMDNALSSDEAALLRDEVYRVARQNGAVPESILEWDGFSIPEYTPETRPLRAALQTVRASEWADEDVQKEYGLPKSLIDDNVRMFTSGDPERQYDVIQFATAMNSQRRLHELVDGMSVGGNSQIGAALYYAVAVNNGLLGDQRPDMQQLNNQIQNILEAGPLSEFLKQDRLGVGESNRASIFRSTIMHMRDELGKKSLDKPGRIGKRGGGERDLEGILLRAFNNGNSAINNIEKIGAAFLANHPHADENAIGAFVTSYLRSEGMRPSMVNENPLLLFDPLGHTGTEGFSDLGEQTAAFATQPFDAATRNLIQQAMGYEAFNVPVTMEEWFKQEYPTVSTELEGQMTWSVEQGVGPGGVEHLLRPAAALGGLVMTPIPAGADVPLDPILSRNDVTIEMPNGDVFILEAGTPISVFSRFIRQSEAEANRVELRSRQAERRAGQTTPPTSELTQVARRYQ